MTDLPFDNKSRLSPDAGNWGHPREIYKLPILPKICSIINIVSALFACVLTVLVTIANSRANVDVVVVLSKLIFWFVTGASVAFLSALSDYVARLLYRIEARNGPSFWKYGEVVDSIAVGLTFASAGVFCWGVWRALAALHGMEVHF